jgi:hypothetical protein
MTQTLDWIFTAKDPNLGLASDENRLIQKFFWYSINEVMSSFGGTLVDPRTLRFTEVGSTYFNYTPPAGSFTYKNPDIYPLSVKPSVTSMADPANPGKVIFKVYVRVRNAVVAEHYTDVTVRAKDGANVLATNTGRMARCGGDALVTLTIPNMPLSPAKQLCFEVTPTNTALPDVDLSNNTTCVTVQANQYVIPSITR